MRRALVVLMLGVLGCGPALPTLDDERGDESSEAESSSEADSSSESTSESTSETTDETTTGETTTDEATTDETGGECPTHSHGMLEIDDSTDLDTLACLIEAQWVYIEGSFTDLSFLSTLEVVGGLQLRGTPQLVDFGGLTRSWRSSTSASSTPRAWSISPACPPTRASRTSESAAT
ncbi:MAG: hypothetical protein HC927_06525 [Deltaproteobacteria bacterium]|nr:hypothetical protein [Deltaproteobacteria bacterium]